MTKVTYTREVFINQADGQRKQTIEVIALVDKKDDAVVDPEVWVHRHNKEGKVIASQEISHLLEAVDAMDCIVGKIDWKALAAEQKADKQLQDI